jgi:hypothetical protein
MQVVMDKLGRRNYRNGFTVTSAYVTGGAFFDECQGVCSFANKFIGNLPS